MYNQLNVKAEYVGYFSLNSSFYQTLTKLAGPVDYVAIALSLGECALPNSHGNKLSLPT